MHLHIERYRHFIFRQDRNLKISFDLWQGAAQTGTR